jgi:hypothetical protein
MASTVAPPAAGPRPGHPYWLRGLLATIGGCWLLLIGVGLTSYCSGPPTGCTYDYSSLELGQLYAYLAILPIAVGALLLMIPGDRGAPLQRAPDKKRSTQNEELAVLAPLAGILLVAGSVAFAASCGASRAEECPHSADAPVAAVAALLGVGLCAGSAVGPLLRASKRARTALLHLTSGTVGVVLRVGLVLSIVVFPWYFGPVHFDETLEFTDSAGLAFATVWGNVHLNLTGSWTASAPTWQTTYTSGTSSESPCWPRCGNATQSGEINWTADLSIELTGGGTSYQWGPTMTFYLQFAGRPSSPDSVQIHLTLIVTPTSQCGIRTATVGPG